MLKDEQMLMKVILSAFFLTFITFSHSAETMEIEQKNTISREEIREMVEEYILKNPEVIIRALQKFEIQKQAEKQKNIKENLANLQYQLNFNPSTPVIGNPDGDITIVEFFDYLCGYCKRVFPTIQTLLENDGKIRYVLKELPILGPNSIIAAKAALAVWNNTPKKYLAFHTALMAARGRLNTEKIVVIARKLGIKKEILFKNMEAQKVSKELNDNIKLSEKLNINGTPAFIIGDRVIPGALDIDELKKIVENHRKMISG